LELRSQTNLTRVNYNEDQPAAFFSIIHKFRIEGRVLMPSILHHIAQSEAFDPQALSAMGEAYDRAIASFSSFPSRPIREAVAGEIIKLAQQGLLDPIKLCEEALAAYGLQSKCADHLIHPDPQGGLSFR
jgi:hypothetical protein